MSSAIPLQLLQPISRGHPQLFQRHGLVEEQELSQHHGTQSGRETSYRLPVKQALRVAIPEAGHHAKR